MKKSVIHISLMNRPVGRQDNRKNKTNGSLFYDRVEGVRKIMSFTLVETFGNETSFVALNRTICVELVFEDPFSPNKVSIIRKRI